MIPEIKSKDLCVTIHVRLNIHLKNVASIFEFCMFSCSHNMVSEVGSKLI